MMQHDSVTPEQHSLSLDERKRLRISGVCDVESFDEHSVVLVTSAGVLMISGDGLHIDRLSLETGELGVEGRVDRLLYADESASGSFWSRLFR